MVEIYYKFKWSPINTTLFVRGVGGATACMLQEVGGAGKGLLVCMQHCSQGHGREEGGADAAYNYIY